MATINAVILPGKANKDGRHKIRISIAHNGTTRYIPTSLMVDSVSEFRKGVIVKRPDAAYLNTKLRGILQHYQDVIDELGYVDGFSCAELIFMMKNQDMKKHHTLSSIIAEYKEFAQVKTSTLETYKFACNVILKHISGDMLLEHITPATIFSFDAGLRKKGLATSTIRNYMIVLKTLINYAVKNGYVNFTINPFASFKIPHSKIRESWVSVEDIRTIRDFKTSKKNLARCRDLFMLSFYLGGMNMVDIQRITFSDKSKKLKYTRQKAENRGANPIKVEFTIPDEAWVIIQKYKNKDGKIQHTPNTEGNHFTIYNMRQLSKLLNIPNLIFYSARKTFSQIAFELGVPDSVIDYILGHSPNRSGSSCLYHYRHVTPQQATDAIRLVLDYLK